MTNLFKFFQKKPEKPCITQQNMQDFAIDFNTWCCTNYPEQRTFGNLLRRAKNQYDRYYSIEELMNLYLKKDERYHIQYKKK